MDAIIPEILCMICSYLNIEDVRRFRLCCRAFADAGACFAFREVVFYLHQGDFDMLRHISLHPIASKNVHSLVYIGHTLEMPRKSLEEFRSYYSTIRSTEKIIAQHRNEAPPPKMGDLQLERLYKNYEIIMDQQERILNNDEDISCIKEVVSRFSSLREITMSSEFWFWDGQSKTPFEGCLVKPGFEIEPQGCRHLDSLLSAVFETDIKLERLTAGIFSWRFFQKPPAEFKLSLPYYANLTCLELCIDTGFYEDENTGGLSEPILGTEVPECRRLMETGLLRDFIKSLTQLQTLYVIFSWHSNEHGYPARLENIMEPKHRWEHLDSLTLGNITCERQDLMSMLRRHKSTLKELCLRDIRLRSTSWRSLLPKIRKTMDLDLACICGELYGQDEDSPFDEYWNLAVPEAMGDELRDEVSDYLVNDRIRRCPLTADNMDL